MKGGFSGSPSNPTGLGKHGGRHPYPLELTVNGLVQITSGQ